MVHNGKNSWKKCKYWSSCFATGHIITYIMFVSSFTLIVVSQLCSVLVSSAIKYSLTEKESYDFDENKAKLKVLIRRLWIYPLLQKENIFLSFTYASWCII